METNLISSVNLNSACWIHFLWMHQVSSEKILGTWLCAKPPCFQTIKAWQLQWFREYRSLRSSDLVQEASLSPPTISQLQKQEVGNKKLIEAGIAWLALAQQNSEKDKMKGEPISSLSPKAALQTSVFTGPKRTLTRGWHLPAHEQSLWHFQFPLSLPPLLPPCEEASCSLLKIDLFLTVGLGVSHTTAIKHHTAAKVPEFKGKWQVPYDCWRSWWMQLVTCRRQSRQLQH